MSELGGGASRTTDPAAGTSSATDVSLREYLMAAINSSREECREGLKHLEASVAAAERNAKENTEKALASIDRRFETVNEFRGALTDLSRNMAKKDDVDNLADKVMAADKSLDERFEALWQRNRDDIDALNRRMDIRDGQAAGSKVTYGNIVALAAFVATVLGIIIILSNVLTH